MKLFASVLAVFLLLGCSASPTEPTMPPPPSLQGHFVGSGVSGITVTVTQDIAGSRTSATTTTDATGFYTVSPLTIGPASVTGISKDKCCSTSLPTQIHAGVNVLDIPVLFLP